MKKWLLTGGILALALVGCGLVPPVKVSDPLGLNGKTVDIKVPAAGLASQSTVSGTVNASFADLTTSIPFTPGQFSACYDFTITATLSGAPVNIKATNIKLDVSVNDGTNGPATISATASEVTITGNGTSYTGSGKNLCGKFSDVGKVVAVVTKAPTPNTVTGTFSLDTDATLPTGTTFTITFLNGSGEIKL